jgi:hypothetical protein
MICYLLLEIAVPCPHHGRVLAQPSRKLIEDSGSGPLQRGKQVFANRLRLFLGKRPSPLKLRLARYRVDHYSLPLRTGVFMQNLVFGWLIEPNRILDRELDEGAPKIPPQAGKGGSVGGKKLRCRSRRQQNIAPRPSLYRNFRNGSDELDKPSESKFTLAENGPVVLRFLKHLGLHKSTWQRAVALCIILVDHTLEQLTSMRLVKGWHPSILT